jgi:hypothetical protein
MQIFYNCPYVQLLTCNVRDQKVVLVYRFPKDPNLKGGWGWVN